jgi:glycosyltransferase involved in cell wall biosynthesis/spore maturation protein CgeB
MQEKQDESVSREQAALLKDRIGQREAELAEAREEIRSEQALRIEGEKDLIRLQEQLKLQQDLNDRRTSGFDQEAAEKESRIRDLHKDLQVQRDENAKILKKLAESSHACQAAIEQSHLLRKQIAQGEAELTKAREEARGEVAGIRVKLDDANMKYRVVTRQVAELKEKILQLNTDLVAAKTLTKEKDQLIAELRTAIERLTLSKDELIVRTEELTVRTEELAVRTEEMTVRAEELTRDKSRLGEEKRTLSEQVKLQALQAKKVLADSNAQIEKLRQQKLAAENQVTQTRAMISFQLGYLLLHGFKSFKAFRSLPGQLLALRQESKRRKAKKKTEKSLIVPTPKVNQSEAPVIPVATAAFSPALRPAAEPVPMLPTFEDFAASLKRLKVACIMDEFTFNSYRNECNLLQLTPSQWQQELDGFKPELLFIESAWRGKDELWGNKVGHRSEELVGIIEWCRRHKVPTVFWNKEDPVHFETFLNTAQMFDYVFTTDIDCIHRYKAALGHDRVYLLPFACQPTTTNPLETFERKDAFCFAGAYYVRYPERTRDLGNFVSTLAAYRPVEIYDRNYGKSDPNYQFPSEYQPFIVGNLPFDQIDKAYKGYRYAINLNSIKQSQSMFARRVFDLLASNTVTVSNFSRGVRLFFGDLAVTTDSGDEVVRRIEALGKDGAAARKFRLAGLRKVMREHTYQDRFAYLVSKLQGGALPDLLPTIAVTAYVKNEEQLRALLENYRRQDYMHKRLLLVVPNGFTPENMPDDESIQILSSGKIDNLTIGDLMEGAGFIAGMVPDDYYGPNYLLDLALATRYSSAEAIGKVTHHVWSPTSGLRINSDGAQYRLAAGVPARSALAARSLVEGLPLRDWVTGLYTRQLEAAEVLAVDEFNYCKNGNTAEFLSTHTESVNDLAGLDTGISLAELIHRSERITPLESGKDEAPVLTGDMLAAYFKPAANKEYKFRVAGTAWEVESSLADEKHDYLYAAVDLLPAELGYSGLAQFYLDVTPGLNLQITLIFLDAQKQRISHVVKAANRNQEAEIPAGTEWIRLGLRIYGGGSARINALVLGKRALRPAEVIGRAEHLVLTNHYPSYDDLYRNVFVHSRVAAYVERGTQVDVFRLRSAEPLSYHEFHNVDVISGSQEALHKLLLGGIYKSVLVHFLDESMWQVLQQHIDHLKVFVWVHGAEIQPWHRRDYNNETEQQRDGARQQSETRMAFWRGLLQEMPLNLKLIFVSSYLADVVMEDLGFRLSAERYEVIHNAIDTELFAYQEKSPELRKKILSIRPYASRAYANDLSVDAILALSNKPWFNDLQFRIIGDGLLFDQTLAPLRQFNNVHIERGFLSRAEIAALHREYGIFLCPSRMDTQGVSRDEAMSSGLVPVTTNVAAIPEFVDGSCGVLAEAEDADGLAAGIAALYEHPKQFLAMSMAAAARVRMQSASPQITNRELELFSSDCQPLPDCL